MTKVGICLAAAFGFGLLASSANAGELMAKPELLASNCFNCHGYNGASAGVIDELDSLPARRIVSKLNDFKDGKNPSTIMGRIAKGYNDAEIEALAKYFGAMGNK